jgi:predicted membrane channel-forming protein YqfA (hemolysin III family)
MPIVILVAIGWMYVAVMMTVAEATSSDGSLLGALVTFVLYGVLPLAIVLYLLSTPARRQARLAAQRALLAEASAGRSVEPDQRGHAPGDPVAPVREEP